MSRRPLRRARAAALLALGALAVHQLHYLIAFGPEGGAALHREGHGYLAELIPVLVALAAASLLATLLLAAVAEVRPGARAPELAPRAALYSIALLLVFTAQELAEGALATGHPAGAVALLGGGAWVAAPLALAVGLGAAFVERLLDRVDEVVAGGQRGPRLACGPGLSEPSPRPAIVPAASAPLAFGLARRPPPAPARP